MKSISAALAAHLTGDALTLATLWRVLRRDGAVFTFTDHDRDIVFGGETYLAALGYQRSAVASGSALAVGETELLGMLDAASIVEPELRAGLWDGAEVRIVLVNWADLAAGTLRLRRGTLGEVTTRDDGSFRAELRGMEQPLQATIGSLYQPECRADLGDARCTIDLSFGGVWTQAATIASVLDTTTLLLANDGIGDFADGWFEGGTVIWQSGDNAGVVREVLAWTQASRILQLFGPPPVLPAVGDALHIQPGCDKRWATCKGKFGNRLHFRGEPTVPGAKSVLETPIRV